MEIVCSKCNATYNIPDNKVPKQKFSTKCGKCDSQIVVDPTADRMPATVELPSPAQPITPPPISRGKQDRFKEYKVSYVVEGGCGTILLGASGIPIKKMEVAINEAAAEGWQVVFQVIENKRFLLFWTREAVIITFGR